MDTTFKCVRCGTCCRWSGYVRINPAETELIASFLSMNVTEFIEKYTRLTSDRQGLSLIEKSDGSCIFYNHLPQDSDVNICDTGSCDLNSCEINEVKPIQCRNFPLIWNFEGWEKECKGAASSGNADPKSG